MVRKPADSDAHRPTFVQCTAVLAFAELLAGLGSNVLAETLAVSLMLLPGAAVTFNTSVTVMFAPFARDATLQFTLPVPPGAGAVQVPAVVATLTKVVPAGVLSDTCTVLAESGPLLVATMV